MEIEELKQMSGGSLNVKQNEHIWRQKVQDYGNRKRHALKKEQEVQGKKLDFTFSGVYRAW